MSQTTLKYGSTKKETLEKGYKGYIPNTKPKVLLRPNPTKYHRILLGTSRNQQNLLSMLYRSTTLS